MCSSCKYGHHSTNIHKDIMKTKKLVKIFAGFFNGLFAGFFAGFFDTLLPNTLKKLLKKSKGKSPYDDKFSPTFFFSTSYLYEYLCYGAHTYMRNTYTLNLSKRNTYEHGVLLVAPLRDLKVRETYFLKIFVFRFVIS